MQKKETGIMNDKSMDRIDWNQLWKELINEGTRQRKNTTSEFWDNFAPTFRKKPKDGEKDEYIEKFYEYMEIEPGETIFDMGCASGTLAIPYAQRGHEVYAADFAPRMLEVLMQNAEEERVADKIHPIQLDWNEDWSKRDLPVCDVAIASRSLIFEDLTSSLKKLESVAKRRICVGAWDTPTPGFDRYVSKAIGYERPGLATHSIIMGELLSRDVCPEMLVIKSPFRLARYESFEAGVETLRKSFYGGLSEEQDQRLAEYCQEHMVKKTGEGYVSSRGDGQELEEYWQLDHSDMSTMGFIRWDKKFVCKL